MSSGPTFSILRCIIDRSTNIKKLENGVNVGWKLPVVRSGVGVLEYGVDVESEWSDGVARLVAPEVFSLFFLVFLLSFIRVFSSRTL